MTHTALDSILDIASNTTVIEVTGTSSIATVSPPETEALTVQSTPVIETLDTDFEFARDKMRDLIQKGQEAVDSAIMLAQSGDSPRAYEVVGGMITAIVQANKELIRIHKIKEDTLNVGGSSSSEPTATPVTIERAVFVGKASDLLREIRALAKPKVASPDAQITPQATDA